MKTISKNLSYTLKGALVCAVLTYGNFAYALPPECSSAALSPNQLSWINFIEANYGNSGAANANKILDLWNYKVTDTSSANYGKPLLSKCTLAQETYSSGMCEYYFRSSQSSATDYLGFPGLPKAPASCGSSRLGSSTDASTGCVNAKGSNFSATWYGLNSSSVTNALLEKNQSIDAALKNILIGTIAAPGDLCGILGPAPNTSKIKGTDINALVKSSGAKPAFYKGATNPKELFMYIGEFLDANIFPGASVTSIQPIQKSLYCPARLMAGSGSSATNLANIIDTFAQSISKGVSGGTSQGQGENVSAAMMQTIPTSLESFANTYCSSVLGGNLYASTIKAMQNFVSFVYFQENYANSLLDSPRVLVYESVGTPAVETLRGYKVKPSVCTAAGVASNCYVTVAGFSAAIAPHSIAQSPNLPLLASSNGSVFNNFSSLTGTPFSSSILVPYTSGSAGVYSAPSNGFLSDSEKLDAKAAANSS